jgi:hypothetical protein
VCFSGAKLDQDPAHNSFISTAFRNRCAATRFQVFREF